MPLQTVNSLSADKEQVKILRVLGWDFFDIWILDIILPI